MLVTSTILRSPRLHRAVPSAPDDRRRPEPATTCSWRDHGASGPVRRGSRSFAGPLTCRCGSPGSA